MHSEGGEGGPRVMDASLLTTIFYLLLRLQYVIVLFGRKLYQEIRNANPAGPSPVYDEEEFDETYNWRTVVAEFDLSSSLWFWLREFESVNSSQ
jgi:hypothetical protein